MRGMAKRFALFAVFMLIGAACGDDDVPVATTAAPVATTAAPVATTAAPAAPPRVAAIMAGTVNDAGFYTQVFLALEMMEEEFGAETTYTELVDVPDAERALRGYAQDGWDIVIAHGGEYPDVVRQVAPDFPDTTFISLSGGPIAELPANVWNSQTNYYKIYYAAGVAAGLVSETGKLGFVGGLPFPVYVSGMNALEQGMKSVNSDAEVLSVFIGHQDDSIAAREAAQSFVEQGADILHHSTNLAVFGVADVAREAEVGFIGFSRDQAQLAAAQAITSVIESYETMYLELVRRTVAGEKGGEFEFDLESGHLSLAPYYGALTDSQAALVEQAIQDVLDGTVEVALNFEQ